MSEGNKFKTDFNDGALVLACVLILVLFAGEPDLHDAILYCLTDGEIALYEDGGEE